MNSLKDLRYIVKSISDLMVVKTLGDTDHLNKKLYAVYNRSGKRLSPFYSVREWTNYRLTDLDLNNIK